MTVHWCCRTKPCPHQTAECTSWCKGTATWCSTAPRWRTCSGSRLHQPFSPAQPTAQRPARSPWSCCRYVQIWTPAVPGTFHQPLHAQAFLNLCCRVAGLQPGIAQRQQPEHLLIRDNQSGHGAVPAGCLRRRRRRVCCHRLQQCHALLAGRVQPPGDCARDTAIQRSSHAGQPDLRRVLCAGLVQFYQLRVARGEGPLLRRTPSSSHWTGPCASSPSLMVRFLSLVAMLHACYAKLVKRLLSPGTTTAQKGMMVGGAADIAPASYCASPLSNSRARCTAGNVVLYNVALLAQYGFCHRGSRRLGLQHVQQHDGEDERPAPAVQARHAIGEPRHPAAQRHHRPSLFS